MSFEVQLKLARYVPEELIKGLDIKYDSEQFGNIFDSKKAQEPKEFKVFEKKADGTYTMAPEPEKATQKDIQDSKEEKKPSTDDDGNSSNLSDKMKKSHAKHVQAMASMFYSVDALPVPQTSVVQFVKEVLVKAVAEVQRSEGAQYKFSFDKQDLPLEITIKKVENTLQIKLNANKELYDVLKSELNNLYAYLKSQNEEEIVMDLNLVDQFDSSADDGDGQQQPSQSSAEDEFFSNLQATGSGEGFSDEFDSAQQNS